MRRAALAAVAGIVFVAACQDTSTAPLVSAGSQAPILGGFSGDNPPPPPIDSGAVGAAQDTQEGQTYSQALAFNTTYFLNKPENTGWLKFKRDQFDTNVDIDNSAAIKMTGGVFSGKGTIQIIGPDRVLVINLAQVSYDGSSFGECSVGITPSATTDGTSRGCYSLQISGAKFVMKDGTTHPASVYLIAGAKKECISREGPCIITPES